jgi:hypothetical protein
VSLIVSHQVLGDIPIQPDSVTRKQLVSMTHFGVPLIRNLSGTFVPVPTGNLCTVPIAFFVGLYCGRDWVMEIEAFLPISYDCHPHKKLFAPALGVIPL